MDHVFQAFLKTVMCDNKQASVVVVSCYLPFCLCKQKLVRSEAN